MTDTNETYDNSKKSMFTVKKVMRALSLLCILLVFCPSFLVSCSGQKVNVNVMTAVSGVSMYGEQVVEPHPFMLICLIIPIVILAFIFKNKIDKKINYVIAGCICVDFVVWIIFRASVKKMAEENYCKFQTTSWYVINIIAILIIMLLSGLLILNKIQWDMDLLKIMTRGRTENVLQQMVTSMGHMSSTVSHIAENVANNVENNSADDNIGLCIKCGKALKYGNRFCTSCGTPISENILTEAENKKKRELEAEARKNEISLFCPECGYNLEPDSVFCESCGTKIE